MCFYKISFLQDLYRTNSFCLSTQSVERVWFENFVYGFCLSEQSWRACVLIKAVLHKLTVRWWYGTARFLSCFSCIWDDDYVKIWFSMGNELLQKNVQKLSFLQNGHHFRCSFRVGKFYLQFTYNLLTLSFLAWDLSSFRQLSSVLACVS